jgi:hypothetical protein
MSANNQVLVADYKGKWYVFNNVPAESWGEWDDETNKEISDKNYLSIKTANAVFDTEQEAVNKAFEIDREVDDEWGMPNSEYGVQINELAKDGEKVIITD